MPLPRLRSIQVPRGITVGLGILLAALAFATPVLAQSAAPLSVTARTGATTADSNELRGGFIIPVIAVIAVILGIIALTGGNGDAPHSP